MSKRFRFSLKLALAITLIVSLPLAYVAKNRAHWHAISELRKFEVEIFYRRQTPTFLDRILGDYRLDEIRSVSPTKLETPVRLLKGLRHLDAFHDSPYWKDTGNQRDILRSFQHSLVSLSLNWKDIDHSNPLFCHCSKLRSLQINKIPYRPRREESWYFKDRSPEAFFSDPENELNLDVLAGLDQLEHLDLANLSIKGSLPKTKLKSLELLNCKFRNLSQFGGSSNLEKIKLVASDVSEVDLLKSGFHVSSLQVSKSRIENLNLAGFQNLKVLKLHNNSLKALQIPKQLTKLQLVLTNDLQNPLHITEMNQLETLGIWRLNPRGMSIQIKSNKRLRKLTLWRALPSCEISNLPNLAFLSAGPEIPDYHLEKISLFPNLKRLIIVGDRSTKSKQMIRKLLPGVELNFQRGFGPASAF